MAKKASTPGYDGDDWLVVGCDDARREAAPSSPQPEKSTNECDLEAPQNQILDSDSAWVDGKTESDPNQTVVQGMKELDETQKPLEVTVHNNYSVQQVVQRIEEMVLTLPQLRRVFPQVTRENLHGVIQVCLRSENKWIPLNQKDQMENLVQLMPQNCQLLVESKFEVGPFEEIADWRSGRFYSDIQENTWRFQLHIGQLVDALDTDNRWYESRVVDMDAVYVKVHYRGWTSKWDEWLRRTSVRLAQLHSKVPNWRAFQVNDEILVGSEVPGKRYPEWREARVTACDEVGSLQIEVEIDGNKIWLDAQDELICQKGTHKAANAGAKMDSIAFAVPHSLLFDYFERPEQLPPSPRKMDAVNAVESVCEATDTMQLTDSDGEGNEWCVVEDDNNHDRDEESVEPVAHTENNQKEDAVVKSEETIAEGTDTNSTSADDACDAVRSDEQIKKHSISPTVNHIFTTTSEILDGQTDTTINEADAWRYQLQVGQLIDARDTDNVWYESRVVALSSTLVKLHYRGWTSKWDEWIERTSTRIAPLHTNVQNWRDFKVGHIVMAGRHVVTKRYPEWRNAVVTSCEACEMDGRLRIEVDVDGCKQWMDAQDEMLCPPGTHRAANSSILKHMAPLF
ncbi:Ubiquitin-specific protease [Phytophthora megakarya]|uniref:Ubiquitin-specific protease n=1 Tax=Phytophthora megakarya TaxID=4795 RepID=A0A225X4N9_9STRA|nr:Ubiquitin-specific protease [Phytophthora megakarya]